MSGVVNAIFGGGGSSAPSSPAPTSQNITTSNIAAWAQPGVSDIVNAGMGQVFGTNPDGSINTNQLNGYTPFNANTPTGQQWVQGAQGSVAGFTPLQQQAQQNIANMQTPEQYSQAMQGASQAGLGALGTTNQANMYGQMGAGYGAMGAQAGASYGQNAQNPAAVQSYMNPYLNATLAPSLQLLNQQYGQQNAANQAAATQQGAFGGGRSAVMAGLNQQNQDLATNQLVANAYNQAYNTANTNMQNAANLGIQGAQTGISGSQAGLSGVGAQQAGYAGLGSQATNLANIAGAQTQTGLGINAAQQAAGATQQQQQQNILNQAMANYSTAQAYPMQQLGTLESLYTGAPQNVTTSTYQAAPSAVSTVAGLGTTALGAAKLAGTTAAKGGIMKAKKYAGGGIASGANPNQINAALKGATDQQLAAAAADTSDPTTAALAKSQQDFRAEARPPAPLPTGITGAPAGQTTFNAAGGGIVAFADGGNTGDDSSSPNMDVKSLLMQNANKTLQQRVDETKSLMPDTGFATDYGNFLKTFGPTAQTQANENLGLRLIQGGMGIASGSSPFANVNLAGAAPAIAGYAQDIQNQRAQQMDLAKQQFELGKFGYSTAADIVKAAQKDEQGTIDNLTKVYGSETAAKSAIESAKIHAGATIQAATIGLDKANAKEKAGITTEFNALVAQGYDPNSPITKQVAQQNYFAATRPYGASSMVSALGNEIAKDGTIKALNFELTTASLSGDKEKVAEIQDKIAARTKELQAAVQQQMGAFKPGTPAVTPPVAPASTTTKAAGDVSAQYTWDPKQNKLVPVSQ